MELVTKKRLHLVSGRANLPLAEEIAERLGVELGDANLGEFANGELHCRFGESVRGTDVFIIQTHSATETMSINDSIMEQLIMVDAAKRASAKRITVVCPYYGYSRQDRKAEGREPISAKLVADMFRVAGAKRLVSVDLHSGQIQGFFDGPVDHLAAMPVLVEHLAGLGDDLVVVSPDAGRVKVAERYANVLHADLAIVHKRRVKGQKNSVEARDVVGEVERAHLRPDRRHDRHRRDPVRGGRAARRPRRQRGLRGRHPRRVLGPGHRPDQELGHLQGGRDQHAAAAAREADRQDRGAVDRPASSPTPSTPCSRTPRSARSSAATTRPDFSVLAPRPVGWFAVLCVRRSIVHGSQPHRRGRPPHRQPPRPPPSRRGQGARRRLRAQPRPRGGRRPLGRAAPGAHHRGRPQRADQPRDRRSPRPDDRQGPPARSGAPGRDPRRLPAHRPRRLDLGRGARRARRRGPRGRGGPGHRRAAAALAAHHLEARAPSPPSSRSTSARSRSVAPCASAT